MKTFRVLVTQEILVTVDDTKFTPEFMEEFRESYYEFDDLADHVEHLGQLYARGLVPGYQDDFIEGYGLAVEMGISFDDRGHETEIILLGVALT